jgi:hypothetical protein
MPNVRNLLTPVNSKKKKKKTLLEITYFELERKWLYQKLSVIVRHKPQTVCSWDPRQNFE